MRNSRHKRSYGNIPYRQLFLVFPEGKLTENLYFRMFSSRKFTVKVFPNNRKSDPIHILQKATDYVRKHGRETGDQVWLVIDRDIWPEEQLTDVCTACREQGFVIAVSNPCFEYWLLLHFDSGDGIVDSRGCIRKLKNYLPHFQKGHVEIDRFKPGVQDAIVRAKRKDRPPTPDWPRSPGSTVYRLVEKLKDDPI
ncbi:MAG: hypothetical protein DRH04_03980 [Deltaproteobacteria bacterium]|nr:MAG: hypothetical protein DRH04_03980 [Deltaproteobacteria bacterium]